MASKMTYSVLPKKYKDHVMAGKYQYTDYDEEEGIACPCPAGNLIVKRPHATFFVPIWLSRPDFDPFARLEGVTMDRGDVLLSTTPKTGTHVLTEVIRMLLAGSAESKILEYEHRWIELATYETITSNQAAPRVLSTHLSLDCLPPNFRRPDTKVVVAMRNLKDTFVSFYHHMRKMEPEAQSNSTWGDYFSYLTHSKSVMYGNFFDIYANIWDKHRSDPNVLVVEYELLVRQPEETIENIAKHTGVTYTKKLVQDIAEATTFKNLRKAKREHEKEILSSIYGEEFSFYRKGEIGDWKNWFTVAQNEEFHRKFDEWNKGRQIPFIYE